MPSRLALIGGEEFADGFEESHASLLKDTGRAQPRVVFLPTCAADDGDEAIEYWCNTAREKFTALGALVETPRVIDRVSAEDVRYAQLIADADLIYFGGGYPHVAMRILPDTRVMAALEDARQRGVFIAGSSGGAMLLGARSEVITPELAAEIGRVWENGAPPDWDPPLTEFIDCLGWVAHGFCAPHFDRVFTWKWLEHGILTKDEILIGIDEQTALVSRADQQWEVRGHGGVTLIRGDLKPVRYQAGEIVRL
jgi:cyanophycinase-like exopeptidase